MSTESHRYEAEFAIPVEAVIDRAALEIVASEFGLPPEHPAVEAIASLRVSKQLVIDGLTKALRATQAERDDLKYDDLTGLMVRKAAMRELFGLIDQMQTDHENPGAGDPNLPDALFMLRVDIIGMHDVNKAGHHVGDNLLVETAQGLENTASFAINFLKSNLRYQDRREANIEPAKDYRHGKDRRHDGPIRDIISRDGGDEFMLAVVKLKNANVTIEDMKQKITERMNDSKIAIKWKMAVFSPQDYVGKTTEEIIKELRFLADPKGEDQQIPGQFTLF